MSEPRKLPPLILHPFSGGSGTDALLEGSLASLALEGLMASADEEFQLLQRMLAGRYQEVRMLLFLGKDIFRWLGQCVEFARAPNAAGGTAQPELRIVEQSFAAMLVENPPEAVKQKLQKWGVTDRRAIFSRSIGIHSIFEEPPPFECMSENFLRNYHRYADHAYICYQHSKAFLPIEAFGWVFDLYASEEYGRIISEGWNLE